MQKIQRLHIACATIREIKQDSSKWTNDENDKYPIQRIWLDQNMQEVEEWTEGADLWYSQGTRSVRAKYVVAIEYFPDELTLIDQEGNEMDKVRIDDIPF